MPATGALGSSAKAAAAHISFGFLKNPALLLAVACVCGLAPFLNKPFHVDDPLYVWAAQHIQRHPIDFYGFRVNWFWSDEPMSAVATNPPLTSYYLAVAGSLFGWSEFALHAAMLIWPVGVAWGTYRLAQRFSSRPGIAVLATLVAPCFLVSSTNLMSDTVALCGYVWTILYWDRGLRAGSWRLLYTAGVLAGLCALTKYSALTVVPLLAAHGLAAKRRLGWWLLPLAIAPVTLAGYEGLTHWLYQSGMFGKAANFAVSYRGEDSSLTQKLCNVLSFTGGATLFALYFSQRLVSRRLIASALLAILTLLATFTVAADAANRSSPWLLNLQFVAFLAGGVGVLWLAGLDLWKRQEGCWLLALWVFGTFLFAACVNWTVNARTVLPMVPAVGILIARRLGSGDSAAGQPTWRVSLAFGPAAVIALVVTWADYRWSITAREAARQVHEFARSRGRKVWFEGHWGFQWYMQALGGKPVDFSRGEIRPGDLLVLPANNFPSVPVDSALVRGVSQISLPACRFLATQNGVMHAGFYAAEGPGRLPFAFGAAPPEQYSVLLLVPPPAKQRR